MSSPLLVANGSATKRHHKTGRELNIMLDTRQSSTGALWSTDFESKLKAFNVADKVVKEYSTVNKRVREPTKDFIKRLILWLVFNPDEYLKVITRKIPLSRDTQKKILNTLEELEYITILDGWTQKIGKNYKAIPRVITATEKLLNLCK